MINYRLSIFTFVAAISLILLLWDVNVSIAGWDDYTGVPVQQTTARKATHNDIGIRRLVRINETTICLADGVNNYPRHEGVYRSTDNGANWSLIGDMNYCNRGTIITGPGEMVYIFWISVTTAQGIYLSKFHYLDTPPDATRIYEGYVKSVGYGGGYQNISAAVDFHGNIYLVAYYAPSDGEVDRIWLIKSFDGGDTWMNPTVIAYESGTSFTYPSLEVDHAGNLILCFAHHSPAYLGGKENPDKRIYFMKSTDQGET